MDDIVLDDIVQNTECRDQVTALRGFKVRSQTLDKYLAANGDTTGTKDGSFPPYYQFDNDGVASHDMSNILRSRVTAIGSNDDSSGILVIVPSVYCHCRSPWVYVAYSYAFIYSQRLITAESLPKQVPHGFEELRQEILGYSSSPNQGNEGRMGLYIVCTFDRQTPLPAELQQRGRPPFQCGVCEETFASWDTKQMHRITVHDLEEGIDDLPEDV